MTHVSAPNTGALPGQRSRKFGSMVGAVVLVIAAGAAIATGIAVTTDDAPAAQPVTNLFTEQREAQRAGDTAASERKALEDLVNRGLIPAQALQSSQGQGLAEPPGGSR